MDKLPKSVDKFMASLSPKWEPTIQLGHILQVVFVSISICGSGFGIYLGLRESIIDEARARREQITEEARLRLTAFSDSKESQLREAAEIQLTKQRVDQLERQFNDFKVEQQRFAEATRNTLDKISNQIGDLKQVMAEKLSAFPRR